MSLKYTFDKLYEENNLSGDVAVIFDRLKGNYIKSVILPDSNLEDDHPTYVYFVENMCINTQTISGNVTFDKDGNPIKNYEIVDKSQKPMQVNEDDFDELTAFNITKEYKLCKQINILAAAILKLAEGKKDSKELKALKEMVDTIESYRVKGEEYKKDFIKRHNAELIKIEILDKHNKNNDFEGIIF